MGWEALLYLAGSAVVADQSRRDVEKRQKKIADSMEQFQAGKAKQGQAAIEKFLNESTPQARATEDQSVKAELQRGLADSVGTAQSYQKPENFSGKVSESYATRRDANQVALKDRLARAMDQLATIGTPQERSLREQFRFGHAGADVDATNSAIRNVGPAYEGAISRVRPNPFDTFFSQALLGAGTSGAGKRAPPDEGTLYGPSSSPGYRRSGRFNFGPSLS